MLKPAHKGIIIVGTDTAVGKTVVAGALAAIVRSRGISVGVMKPIASGCRCAGSVLVSDDALFLQRAAGLDTRQMHLINPIRLAHPLAPSVAAEREKKVLDMAAVFDAFKELNTRYAYMIIEGIGGVHVPITDTYWLIHLIAEPNLPVVVVGRNALGTINHTLLSIEALRQKNICVSGFILNEATPGHYSIAEETNPSVIERSSGLPCLGVFPYIENVTAEMLGNKEVQARIQHALDSDRIIGGLI